MSPKAAFSLDFSKVARFRSAPRRQRGIAVVTAILIAALVASLAFALSARQRQWLNLVSNRADLAAARSLARSGIDLACLTLRDDMRGNQVDHLYEAWTVPIPPVNVGDGEVGGRIVELQGRFNLFNLQSGGRISVAGVAALRRLLPTRGLPANWADALAAAMAGREAAWLQQAPTSAGKSLVVANLAELADIAGIGAESIAPLEPLVTVLPEATSINVNFAPPEVLMAVTPGLSLREAERLTIRRAAEHFLSGQDFVNALSGELRTTVRPTSFTVESQYFLAETEARSGRANVRLHALIYRQRGRMSETVWIRQM